MSELLRDACEEAKSGNLTVKQQLREIGNMCLNSVEISPQEAVYIALQLPMRRALREVIFIPNFPPDERTRLLKSLDEIERLEDDYEDVESSGLIKRYSERPHVAEKVTLAEWAAFYDGSYVRNSNKMLRRHDVDGLLFETLDEDNEEDDIETTAVKSNKKMVAVRH